MAQITPQWLKPSVFEDLSHIVAGFSFRHEGLSEPPFATLNLGISTGDKPETVMENRRLLLETAGLSLENLSTGGQVHGARIRRILNPELCSGYDGLTTTVPGVILSIVTADCAAVLLADSERQIIGACHSGWRGTLDRIAEKTVSDMVDDGARPEAMRAYISPCISVENFEVGLEVAEKFESQYVKYYPGKDKPHVDLKAVITDQLVRSGIPRESIEVSPFCTMAEADRFFSYRAENGRTGRMMGFIAIKNNRV